MEMEVETDVLSKKERQKKGNEKQVWLITYGSSCQSITHKMLLECGLEVDECYTATWRESKYTLLHVHKDHRLRRTAMSKIMQRMMSTFHIVETGIFGFDSVSCNSKAEKSISSLEDHPGFCLMIERVNKDPVDMEWWISCGTEDICANRKGLLWKYIESTDATNMTRAQLVERVRKWAPMMLECEELKTTNTMLGEQNGVLIKRIDEIEKTLLKEQLRNSDLTMQLIAKLDECGNLEREMIRSGASP